MQVGAVSNNAYMVYYSAGRKADIPGVGNSPNNPGIAPPSSVAPITPITPVSPMAQPRGASVFQNSDGDYAQFSRPYMSRMGYSGMPNPAVNDPTMPQAFNPAVNNPAMPQAFNPAVNSPGNTMDGPNGAMMPGSAIPGFGVPGGLTPNNKASFGAEPREKIPVLTGSEFLDSLKPEGECYTCSNRKYVDGSDDASVSYQTPTKLNPQTAASAVAAHEQEHVINERADAQREGREVINQSVTLHYDTCPECGKSYVSGGTTRTTTVGKEESNLVENNEKDNGDNSGI